MSSNFTEKYNIVRVSNVEPEQKYVRPNVITLTTAEKELLEKKCKCAWQVKKNGCPCKSLAYYENNGVCKRTGLGFYGAFAQAYNTHTDVIISPDDVWMIIMLQLKKYVTNNSEKMRHLFVSHEGKQKLVVTTGNQLDESQWEEFFTLMIDTIKSNTKEGIVDHLQADFTTTGIVEKMLSTAVIIDSFKNYFDYGRCIPMCGIRHVMFMGTLEDWTKLLEKVIKLKSYSVDDFWTKYIDEIEPIIKKFIDTYQGKVDTNFWDKIMNIKYGHLGSGSTSYVSGWILKFYGLYEEVETADIKEELIDVPVEIDNKLTGIKKMVSIFGGFGGVTREVGECEIKSKTNIGFSVWSFFNSLSWSKFDKTDETTSLKTTISETTTNISYDAYRPQMSFIVYHDGNEKKSFEC